MALSLKYSDPVVCLLTLTENLAIRNWLLNGAGHVVVVQESRVAVFLVCRAPV